MVWVFLNTTRAITRTLIRGGCVYSYIHVARQISFQIDQFEFDLKRNSAEHEYMNINPLPINVLVRAVNRPRRSYGSMKN